MLKSRYTLFIIAAAVLAGTMSFFTSAEAGHHKKGEKSAAAKPLKILLIAGGCCHDYIQQAPVIKDAIESQLNAEVVVDLNKGKGTDVTFPSYEKEDWAKAYDLIIHNECSANVKDPVYVKRILDAHRAGTPAVNLHCAMHSYRWGDYKKAVKLGADNAHWFEMIGVQSSGHGPKYPVKVEYAKNGHPSIKGLADWTTPVGELYNNIQVFDSATVLAKGSQTFVPKPRKKKGKKPAPAPADAKPKKPTTLEAAIVWSNIYGPNKTKTFSISVGHSSAEMKDENFKKLLIRGVLWTTDNINEDGSAKKGVAKAE